MLEHLLITGGAGFIGSHLADRWLAEGGRVTVLDDLSTGALANLVDAARSPRLAVVQGSVLDRRRVRALVEEADSVAHLAAVVGVERVCRQPRETWTVNLEGGRTVLDAAAEVGRPVLLASSSEVYGDSAPLPSREDGPVGFGPPEHPRWSYAASKLAVESYGLALERELGLPVRVVRFFNTSGPRQSSRSGMVLPRWVEAALDGRPLEVHGDGRQSRCFCHVADAVEALVRLMREPRTVGRVVNIGSEQEHRLEALARAVVERTGSRSEVVSWTPEVERDDPRRRVPSLERLRTTVDFVPERPVESIIDDLVSHVATVGRPPADAGPGTRPVEGL
ncbi:MAG: NAD-dependent epimerase/dehydratase family protein [Planctomycetota bacterium]